jgi:hypothetical protein
MNWLKWLNKESAWQRRKQENVPDKPAPDKPDRYAWLAQHGKEMKCACLTFDEARYVVCLARELSEQVTWTIVRLSLTWPRALASCGETNPDFCSAA